MLEISRIKEDKESLVKALAKRGIEAGAMLDEVLELDAERRSVQVKMDDANSEMNTISKSIGALMQQGKKDEAEKVKAKTGELKALAHDMKAKLSEAEEKLQTALMNIPNVPHELVPQGKDEEDNECIAEFGDKPEFGFEALPHWELAAKYGLIDFETGVKVTGAGFPFYTGKGARLQRGLINFFLDEAANAGYKEMVPPFVINEDSGFGTGQLPDKEGQMYHITADDLYLIPTSEVCLVNTLRGDKLDMKDFPIKMTAYSPCFRREAGSYGAHVRGLNRLHQFDKVELVQVTSQEEGYAALDGMVEHVKGLLSKLELPYRILRLCGGDLGVTAAMTYDFEVYSAGQGRWLEISSCSNTETYQSNRMKLRYKDGDGKKVLAHCLNGSALALPRVIAGLLENHQTEDGIRIPEALVPYVGFDKI